MTDLIFIPIDEGMAQIAIAQATLSTTGALILDNTGYLGHGDSKQNAISYVTNANSGGVSQEVRGQDITLTPRVNQRLYFIKDLYNTDLSTPALPVLACQASDLMTIMLNIVPRWAGIRDQ